MNIDDDQLLKALSAIPPDINREALVKRRCHAAIAKRAARQAHITRAQMGLRLLESAAATVLFVYLVVTLAAALNLGHSL